MKKRKIDPLEEIMSNPYYQLRDDYNYAEKVKGTISFGQYSMKYWALERDIVLDETKSEVTEEMFVRAADLFRFTHLPVARKAAMRIGKCRFMTAIIRKN